MPGLEQTLSALADEHRRAVVNLLREQPRRAGELAEALDLSPPAMSRHLRVLRRSGLISEDGIEEDARVRVYKLEREPFDQLRQWLDEIQQFWDGQLAAFADHVRSR